MLVVEVVCVVAISFLVACLKGFQSALSEKHISWAVIANVEDAKNAEPPLTEFDATGLPKTA